MRGEEIADPNQESADERKAVNMIPGPIRLQEQKRHAIEQPDWNPQWSDQIKSEYRHQEQSTDRYSRHGGTAQDIYDYHFLFMALPKKGLTVVAPDDGATWFANSRTRLLI